MINECNEGLVVILPDPVPEKSESGKIILPDLVQENMKKLQNRGTVVMIGQGVKFPKQGWYVSFYRAAATPIVSDDKEYLIIHKDHVLASIVNEN